MLRKSLLGFVIGAVIVAAGGAAFAADMPARAPMYTKAPAIVADPWTGFYLGVSAGGRWNKDTWTTTSFGIPAIPAALSSRDNPHNFSSGSGRFGLYGGYNWRVQQVWVVGLEADFAWAQNKSTNTGIPGLTSVGFPVVEPTQIKDSWDGGIRARGGYLITPTMLLYGTGGVSWMRSEASVACSTAGNWCSGTNFANSRTDSVSKTVVGWTLGGGIEAVGMRNWLLRGEYRYSSYAGYHASLLNGGGPAIDVIDADIGRIKTHTALIGLAYKFGN
jgi:outer membrane immunogenic protein